MVLTPEMRSLPKQVALSLEGREPWGLKLCVMCGLSNWIA